MAFKSAQDFIDDIERKMKPKENVSSANAQADTSNIAKYGDICKKLGGQIYKNGNVCRVTSPIKMDIEFTSLEKNKWQGKIQGE